MKKALFAAAVLGLSMMAADLAAQTSHYLFVAGGRETDAASAGITPNDTLSTINSGANIDFINVLVADVDVTAKSVGNWRIAGVLPANHPDATGSLQWSYLHDAVNVYNNRLYVGPATFNGTGSVTSNFVAYADINADGTLGTFAVSPRFPAPNDQQRTSATEIVEVGGTPYIYVLGGSGNSGQIARIIYAPINTTTGEIGAWQETTTPLPVADWFTGAVTHAGAIINVRGNLGTTRSVDWAPIATGGNITSAFTNVVYDATSGARWDYGITKTVSGGNTFVHVIAGTAPGTIDQVHYAQLDNTTGAPGAFTLNASPLPAVRRRMTAAAAADMIVVPGGSTTTSFAAGTSTVFIGTVASNGAVTWTTSPTAMSSNGVNPQARSFHGAAIAPLPPPPLSVPTWNAYN